MLAVMMFMVVGACGSSGRPLTTLNPRGDAARIIHDLISPVFIIAGVVFVIINFGVLFLAVKFRRGDSEEWPKQVHGNTALELGWTIVPALILAGVAVGTVTTLFKLDDTPETDIEVTVYGQQWWWSYDYDLNADGEPDFSTANELVIPAGKAVSLKVKSNDVIHSFWIPALNGKRDAVPGRTHPWWLEADEPGVYYGQCTEFCGLSHAKMQMRTIALEPAEYEAWVANQMQDAAIPTDQAALRGLSVFTQQCASCHQIEGVNAVDCVPDGATNGCFAGTAPYDGAEVVSGLAPNLTHLMSRSSYAGSIFELYDDEPSAANYLTKEGLNVDRAQLKAWIRNPSALKPMAPNPNEFSELGRGMPALPLTEDQLDDLVTYLETLK